MPARQPPKDWSRAQLGTLASVNRGVTWSREQEMAQRVNGAVPVVRIGNLQLNGFQMNETLFIQGVGDHEKSRKTISPRTVVMVGSNGNRDRVGNAFLATQEVTGHLYASFLIGIEPSDAVSERFLTAWLRSTHVQSLITEATAGSTGLKNLSLTWLRALNVDLPPFPEQRAIAAVLDAVDDAIERTEAVIAATEELRCALLHELLTRGVPGMHSEWKHVPGLGTVPACWEVTTLDRVADVQTGRAVNKARNGARELPYLSVANVKDGYLNLSVVKTMVVSEDEVARYGLEVDDVLLTEGGDADKLGRGTIWRGEITECLHQNHVFAVRAKRSCLMPEFLAAYVGGNGARRYFLGASKQTTNLASVNSTQLRQLPLPLPSMDEQHRIVEVLQAAGITHAARQAALARAQALKATLADALLSGRVSTRVAT